KGTDGEPTTKVVLDELKDSYNMGDVVGKCEVYMGDNKVGEGLLYADRDVEKANFLDNFKYNMKNLFKKGI
ncbi:D-alanyl-D-alanine carboxypeptidase, partial [Clostridium saudiense]|nr:D-alanyl-D-alanine carboxypeptidase [Clostridium saudiense]